MLLDALSTVKTRNPLTVFAVFAIGIIIPGGFLSYLGLRSFQYEGALMQKQTEEHYAAVADVIQKQVSTQLSDVVGELKILSQNPSIEQLHAPAIISLMLSSPKLHDLPIENLYVFDDQDQMVAPWSAKGSYRSYDDAPPDINWGNWSDEINRLDHVEFVDKNIPMAISGYTALEGQHLPVFLQAQLVKSVADGYRKLHQPHEAEAQYVKLDREYDQIPDTSGLPMGIFARQLLIRLYDQDHDLDRALDTRLDLLEGLIQEHWLIAVSEKNSLTEELQSSIRQVLAAHPTEWGDRRGRFERLETLKGQIEDLKARGQAFNSQEWPDLSKRLRERGWIETGGILDLQSHDLQKAVALVTPIFSPATQRRQGLLIAIINGDLLWAMMEQTLDTYAKPVGLQVSWDHSSARLASLNRSSSGLWTARINRQVDSIDPPMHFRLYELNSQEQSRLSRRRLWIYGGMIGLSFIVIIVGLVVMRQAMKREMEVANLKADFVANVSHELRTPLTTISYVGERLNLGRYRTDEERQKFYGMLDRETHRLKDLIEDVLDFSKMLAGKKNYQQEPLDLAPLVQDAFDHFQGKAKAKGFEVLLDLPSEDVTILGDKKALLQGVLNLMDNALKYSGQSRKIQVRVSKTTKQAIIAVQDYGIGIPESEKEKIFEKFYRVEQGPARDTAGGVGLGLAMVRHTVEGHGGQIRVESRLGEGSTFSMEFPLKF